MAKISNKEWERYVALLRRLDNRASTEMLAFITPLKAKYDAGAINEEQFRNALINKAFYLATKYGEGASELACEMYDATAERQGVIIPPAEPAPTATIAETAKTVNGTLKTGNPEIIASAVGRLVKQAAADTTLQNAKRDNAWFAWVAHGDTCAYCLALAGIGWQKAGKLTLDGGHAEHIHSNCDCEYAIDLKGDLEIADYDPNAINRTIMDMTDEEYDAEDLLRMSGHNAKGHDNTALNAIRRKFYAKNKEIINEQKRSAYAKKIERESSVADEINVD